MFQKKQKILLSTFGASLFLLCAILSTEVVDGANATVSRRDVHARFDEHNGNFNMKAARLSQDKREIIQFLNTKNVIKTMYKILFGDNKDSVATSRQVLNVFVKVRKQTKVGLIIIR